MYLKACTHHRYALPTVYLDIGKRVYTSVRIEDDDFDVSRLRVEKLDNSIWLGVAFTLGWVLIFFGGLFLLAAFK